MFGIVDVVSVVLQKNRFGVLQPAEICGSLCKFAPYDWMEYADVRCVLQSQAFFDQPARLIELAAPRLAKTQYRQPKPLELNYPMRPRMLNQINHVGFDVVDIGLDEIMSEAVPHAGDRDWQRELQRSGHGYGFASSV